MPVFEIIEDPEQPFSGLPVTIYQVKCNDVVVSIGAASVKDDKALTLAFEVPTDLQRQGVGKAAFLKGFQKYSSLYNIEYIVGKWSVDLDYSGLENCASTNLNIFNNKLQNMSAEEAAMETATGKWAKTVGYDKPKIIRMDQENVIVHFYKTLPKNTENKLNMIDTLII